MTNVLAGGERSWEDDAVAGGSRPPAPGHPEPPKLKWQEGPRRGLQRERAGRCWCSDPCVWCVLPPGPDTMPSEARPVGSSQRDAQEFLG